jgi:uncharacterized protein (DUF924 family)
VPDAPQGPRPAAEAAARADPPGVAPDAARVLAFWFGDATRPEADLRDALVRWFRATPGFDAEVRARFEPTIAFAAAGALEGWTTSPRGRLALIVVCDQLSRNAFRDTPRAFATDERARRLCREGLARRDDAALTPVERHFFLLPLLHSEDLRDQGASVAAFERLRADAPPHQADYFEAVVQAARRYHAIIARFGRFPHRNAILGRSSTGEEAAFLAASAPRWEGGPRAG